MAKITLHAKNRLKERYGVSDEKKIQIIMNHLNLPAKYSVVSSQDDREVRQIVVNEQLIQAVVTKNHILTFIPATFEAAQFKDSVSSHRVRIEKIESRIKTQSEKIKHQEEMFNNMLNKRLFVSIVYFLYYRTIKKEKNE